MPDFKSLDRVSSHQSFQVAWESTLKCNLDCSYCGDGHDNNQPHPNLENSLQTVDFIVEYLNLYMMTRHESIRHANLNIQGGESIYHPNIIEILEYLKNKKNTYSKWNLNVSLITNGITGLERWKKIAAFIDYFTMSYHSESSPKQQDQFKANVLYLKEQGKNFKVSVLMHPKFWDNCTGLIEWCKQNDIPYLPRQLDHSWLDFRFNYNESQTEFLTGTKHIPVTTKVISIFKNGINLSATGRACCGGETMCNDTGEQTTYIKGNNFKGWHCSVNRNFLYVRQATGEIYTNKDCRMNLENKVGVLGYLQDSQKVLDNLKHMIETNTLPDIICKKNTCWCGLCAPKAVDKEMYDQIMEKYLNVNASH
jgi:pyruvate-formate lyase-activating enzyme